MDILKKFFKNRKVNISKLKDYGFIENEGEYFITRTLKGSDFEMTVYVSEDGKVSSQVIDQAFDEPYTLHLFSEAQGGFVGQVKAEYEALLEEIAECCFDRDVFSFEQTKRLIEYIRGKYGDELEFLWEKYDNNAVWRRKDTGKWYGVLLTIPESKLGFNGDKEIEILDLHIEPQRLDELVDNKKYFRGYHMNKKHWLTVVLDGSLELEKIFKLVDDSYNLAKK